MDNLYIYNKYRTVPKDALKSFDTGKFKGTEINTMWRIRCLTEQFGVIGFGWTVKVLRTWTEKLGNDEMYAFAELEMKLCIDGKWGEPFSATGGNKLETFVKSQDAYKGNDEAFKMAITDAFGVLCKFIGIGADVYWGNDTTKYTAASKQPTATQTAEKTANAPAQKANENELPFPTEETKSQSQQIAEILVKQEYIDRLKNKVVEIYGRTDFDTLNDYQFGVIKKMAIDFKKKKKE